MLVGRSTALVRLSCHCGFCGPVMYTRDCPFVFEVSETGMNKISKFQEPEVEMHVIVQVSE